jgi:hypothetical protein
MSAHEWTRGYLTGVMTCARCRLLPLDDDDVATDCDPGEVCPACGSPVDSCQGHGWSRDPYGAAILAAHDAGRHDGCHSRADCDDDGGATWAG